MTDRILGATSDQELRTRYKNLFTTSIEIVEATSDRSLCTTNSRNLVGGSRLDWSWDSSRDSASTSTRDLANKRLGLRGGLLVGYLGEGEFRVLIGSNSEAVEASHEVVDFVVGRHLE